MSVLPNSLKASSFISPSRESGLPLFQEYKYDFEKNELVLEDGRPVLVSGNEALKIWLFFALITERFMYEAYSKNYGNDVWTLMGEVISDGFKKAEIKRYCKECIMANPYIRSIDKIDVEVDGSKVFVYIKVTSIYEDEVIDVAVEL